MPLVKTSFIINKAKKKESVIAAFNVLNLEMIKAIIEAAEETNNAVILQVTERAIKWAKFEYIAPVLIAAAKNSQANIAVHLDHTNDLNLIKKAINFNFSSVMYDGSHLNINENIKNSQQVIEWAHNQRVEVEIEIGQIGGKEDSQKASKVSLPPLKQVINFYDKTKPDFLAVAFGTSHGLYKQSANLDFEFLNKVSQNIKVPLVMHGTSGLSPSEIKNALKNGIAKVNIGTDLLIANYNAIRKYLIKNPNEYNLRKINQEGINAIKKKAKEYFLILKN